MLTLLLYLELANLIVNESGLLEMIKKQNKVRFRENLL